MKTDVNVNLESKTVEKGLDAAKGFLSKLMSPALEETGLMIKDQVAAIRFRNQIKLLNKTKAVCEKNNINPKAIPLKLLYPLLENASLEEDEILQDKWAILLSNLVDSEQNVENHVFPFLLSQISKHEFETIEESVINFLERRNRNITALNLFNKKYENKIVELKAEKTQIPHNEYNKRSEISKEIYELEKEQKSYIIEVTKTPTINEYEFESFEIYNLIRLGILISIPKHYVYMPKHTAQINTYSESVDLMDVDIQIENDGYEYVVSELGIMFFKACMEKNK
jgi:hypothetical protein